MRPDQIREVVSALPAYPQWDEAVRDAQQARDQMPVRNENDPSWLRAQAAMLDTETAITPLTAELKLEVVEAQGELSLPFRIGMLRALDRRIGVVKRGPGDALMSIVNVHLPGHNRDLGIQDYAFSPNEPFRYAAEIGGAIREVENALPKLRRSVPAAVIGIGNNFRGIQYMQPTTVDYYHIIPPEDGQLCKEPIIETKKSDTAEESVIVYNLPRLLATEALYNGRKDRIVSITEIDRSTASFLSLPKIDMLESTSRGIYPTKLLIGKEAIKFARKHLSDVKADQREVRARAENHNRLKRLRW